MNKAVFYFFFYCDRLGGTLKIYGSDINPDVPYKTLLLSVTDSAAQVIRETLEKYGLDKLDPSNFCLVQVCCWTILCFGEAGAYLLFGFLLLLHCKYICT